MYVDPSFNFSSRMSHFTNIKPIFCSCNFNYPPLVNTTKEIKGRDLMLFVLFTTRVVALKKNVCLHF